MDHSLAGVLKEPAFSWGGASVLGRDVATYVAKIMVQMASRGVGRQRIRLQRHIVSQSIARLFGLLGISPGSMCRRYGEFFPGGKMKRLLLPLVLISLPCVAWSAPKPQASAAPAATGAAGTASSSGNDFSAASTEMLSVIQALSGRWAVEVSFEPSPDAPKGAQGNGEEFWHAGAQGLTLIDEENIHVPPMDIHLLGMLWWDSAEKKFHGMECVNQNPHACDPKAALNDVTITWDGKQLTIDEIETSPDRKEVPVARNLLQHHFHVVSASR